jgi:hypothetical protein
MVRWFLLVVAVSAAAPFFSLSVLATAQAASAVNPPGLVSGLAPYQRPQGAPVIREFVRTADWRARALTGISEPLPASLGFLNRQGAWHTPFIDPGMPGYYDLRAWHRGPGDSAKQGR